MIRAKSCMLCWLRRCVWEWRPADTPVGFERLLGELQSESWIGDAAEIRTNQRQDLRQPTDWPTGLNVGTRHGGTGQCEGFVYSLVARFRGSASS